MAQVGRPTDYCPELIDKICDRLTQGESLKTICKDADMPNTSSIFLWLAKYPEFSDKYARAKSAQMDTMAEEIVEISDDRSNDVTVDEKGNEKVDWECVQRSKLKVDTRKWLMSKLAPKKYGELKTLQHQGPNGGPMQSEVIERGAQVSDLMELLDPETRQKVVDAYKSRKPK